MCRPIAITLGDPAGIGPEIVLKALPYFKAEQAWLIGPRAVLERTASVMNLRVPAGLTICDFGHCPSFGFGKVQNACGEVALQALKAGALLLRAGTISGLVTAPVSKESLRLAGFRFPGQTEYLAASLGVRRYGMIAYTRGTDDESANPARRDRMDGVGRAIRIALVTIHRPLAEVPKAIAARAVAEKIALLHVFLCEFEGIRRPRIAVLALNPHAWEFTHGEEARIARGIKLATVPDVQGPFPGDTIDRLLEDYDGVVAMYHDQAMIPAKLLAHGRGVNLTMGLPRIRTSPLHGTAFDIAGKGIASPDSMIAAIEACLRFSRLPHFSVTAGISRH